MLSQQLLTASLCTMQTIFFFFFFILLLNVFLLTIIFTTIIIIIHTDSKIDTNPSMHATVRLVVVFFLHACCVFVIVVIIVCLQNVSFDKQLFCLTFNLCHQLFLNSNNRLLFNKCTKHFSHLVHCCVVVVVANDTSSSSCCFLPHF